MAPVSRSDFVRAFAARSATADGLARAIDSQGFGAGRNDGVLTSGEVQAALKSAQGNSSSASALRSAFRELFGDDFAAALSVSGAFESRVTTERAAQGITEPELRKDISTLCKDPSLSVRDPSTPEYMKAARFVADQLKAAGVQPLGDVSRDGRPTYFQAFRWEDRYTPGAVGRSSNVVGVLPGTGPQPREAVLVIAHLDNISQAEKDWYARNEGRQIPRYEGANDNTASVAALLGVARGLQAAGGTRRDIIFLVPSAEEDGLKGTEAFVKAPPLPLERVVGAVNMEMIGRNTTDQVLIYGGRTTAEVGRNALYSRAMKVAERSKTTVKAGLENDDGERWYDRSDHAVTANAGIPSIMFHGRTTRGNYHTADDTLENLNFEKVRVTAQQVLRVVRDLADDPAPREKKEAPAAVLNRYPGRVWPGAV